MNELTRIALNIARNTAWPVFPCAENKAPAISKAEGGRGFHDASTDPDIIQRLFNHRNAVLIGIPTGPESGFDVLDVDVKHPAARAWLAAAEPRLPATRTYRTRSGGLHLLFRHVEGVRNSESLIAKGVDTRGDGGFVVFWFAAGFECVDCSPITDWPAWLLEALRYKPFPPRLAPSAARPFVSGTRPGLMVDRALARVRSAARGSRHHTLRAAACTIGGLLDAAGISRNQAEEMLLQAVLASGGGDIDRRNALGTIAWALDRGTSRPLTMDRR